MKVKMTYEKSTPGTFRFKAVEENAPITSLYIKKSGLKKPAQNILVTVEITNGSDSKAEAE